MKRLFTFLILPLVLASALTIVTPHVVTAATGGNSSSVPDPAVKAAQGCNRSGCNLIRNYINPVIVLLSTLVGIAVAIGIMVGGIQVASSAGDPQKSASGKKHIQNAIIGLVGYAVLFAFLQFLIPGGVV